MRYYIFMHEGRPVFLLRRFQDNGGSHNERWDGKKWTDHSAVRNPSGEFVEITQGLADEYIQAHTY